MHEDVVAPLVAERFGPSLTPPPAPAPSQDTPEVIERRQRVLAEIPGDEGPAA